MGLHQCLFHQTSYQIDHSLVFQLVVSTISRHDKTALSIHKLPMSHTLPLIYFTVFLYTSFTVYTHSHKAWWDSSVTSGKQSKLYRWSFKTLSCTIIGKIFVLKCVIFVLKIFIVYETLTHFQLLITCIENNLINFHNLYQLQYKNFWTTKCPKLRYFKNETNNTFSCALQH